MNVLFVNSVEQACGVHQFGLNIRRILTDAGKMIHFYCEPRSDAELKSAIEASEADIVLYNFYPCTMPWLSLATLNMVRGMRLKQVTIFHEVPVTGFDGYLYPDPTFERRSKQLTDWFPMGRPLPEAMAEDGGQRTEVGNRKGKKAKRPTGTLLQKNMPVIGSAGFGFGWKGHRRLVERVVFEFPEGARIRLHIPFATFGDADGSNARKIADECRYVVLGKDKEQFVLEISHEFMAPEDFVRWLASNDLNAFLYDDTDHSRGIASTIDHALAARRPIAVTRSWMFRHLWDVEGIFVEDSPLSAIIARGVQPLQPIYERFSDENVRREIEEALAAIRSGMPALGESSRFTLLGYNRLLSNADRELAEETIAEMREAEPELMGRKIPEANVQQAWALEMIGQVIGQRAEIGLRPDFKILCVGCFEDPTFQFLNRWLGATGDDRPTMIGIDARDGMDLATHRQQFPDEKYDCVFATSVVEHVQDDEQFIRDICGSLKQDGVALLTADYKSDYKPGDPLPASDVRFYTPDDFERIGKVLWEQGCYWKDRPELNGEPDFVYQGHRYSFVTMVFKKL